MGLCVPACAARCPPYTGKLMNSVNGHNAEPADYGGTALDINARRTLQIVFVFCVLVVVLLFFLDYMINWNEGSSRESIRSMFDTTAEHSIAGWFSATLTFVVAMAAGANVVLVRSIDAPVWRRTGWLVIALLFAYLALDDGAAIHEHLGGGLKQTPVIGDVIGAYDSYSWHIVILPFFVAIGFFMLVFLWKELAHRNERIGILTAFSFLALAVGQDFIEGTTEEYDWFEATYGMDPYAILHFAKSVEESLEMLGMTMFLVVFLSHLMRTFRTITLRFQ